MDISLFSFEQTMSSEKAITDQQKFGQMHEADKLYPTEFAKGGEPYTHGVNTITLRHDGVRWWIMGWIYDDSAGKP